MRAVIHEIVIHKSDKPQSCYFGLTSINMINNHVNRWNKMHYHLSDYNVYAYTVAGA